MSILKKLFSKKQSATVPGGEEPQKKAETELTTCSTCHNKTPFPEPEASYGTALICANCHTPLIRPSDPDSPISTSPNRLNIFYGLVGRGLEHPRCPFCHKINYAIVFPAKGMSLSWYAVPEPENPSGFNFKVICVNCNKDFYIEWDENPF